jgi:hypothetical protein
MWILSWRKALGLAAVIEMKLMSRYTFMNMYVGKNVCDTDIRFIQTECIWSSCHCNHQSDMQRNNIYRGIIIVILVQSLSYLYSKIKPNAVYCMYVSLFAWHSQNTEIRLERLDVEVNIMNDVSVFVWHSRHCVSKLFFILWHCNLKLNWTHLVSMSACYTASELVVRELHVYNMSYTSLL